MSNLVTAFTWNKSLSGSMHRINIICNNLTGWFSFNASNFEFKAVGKFGFLPKISWFGLNHLHFLLSSLLPLPMIKRVQGHNQHLYCFSNSIALYLSMKSLFLEDSTALIRIQIFTFSLSEQKCSLLDSPVIYYNCPRNSLRQSTITKGFNSNHLSINIAKVNIS